MRREDRLLRRLQRETKDWCRKVQGESHDLLSSHRDGVQAHPEVWD